MALALEQRPLWDIDRMLERLTGHDIRAAAKAFSPIPCNGEASQRFIPVRDLYLPDNSQPAGLPVFFEGRLQHFERQIGVVFARLDAPASVVASPEGVVCFRGHASVILRGPAVVELAFPFYVEPLPDDSDNYWRDLRVPRAQFEFPFPPDPLTGADDPGSTAKSPGPMISRSWPGAID